MVSTDGALTDGALTDGAPTDGVATDDASTAFDSTKSKLADHGLQPNVDTGLSSPPDKGAPKPPPAGQWTIRGVSVYSKGSVWSLDVRGAPLDPKSSTYVAHWDKNASNKGINLVGATNNTVASYSFATTYGEATDPIYTVSASSPQKQTFQMRVDPGAQIAPGDGELVIFDLVKGEMLEIAGSSSVINHAAHTITAQYWNWRSWSMVPFGLDRDAGSGHLLARGHRGFDSTAFGFRFEEVQAKSVPHMVKLTVPSAVAAASFVWPYVGHEGKPGIVPEGSRVRIKATACASIRPQLANDYARAMLDSLCTHGSIISDCGGAGINMKLENPANWASLGISKTSLSAVKITDFEFISPSFGKP